MKGLVESDRPRLSERDAARVARELFGIDGDASTLPSERDQNFRIATATGEAFVLKLANAQDDAAVLDLQNRAIERIAERAPGLGVPAIVRATDGAAIGAIDGRDGRVHRVRVLRFLDGTPLADVTPRSAELMRDLGRFLGRADDALSGLEHPAMRRELRWDLQIATSVIDAFADDVADPDRRELVARFARRHAREVEPRLGDLRRSLIHNDANDHNVLVSSTLQGQRVTGVIDFGDCLYSYTVADVAVAAAYAMLDQPDPLGIAAPLIAGYDEAFALRDDELDVVFDLASARLCMSVVISAHQQQANPDNRYLSVSEAAAFRLLERLEATPSALARAVFRAACGREPCPNNRTVVGWLRAHGDRLGPVIDADVRNEPVRVLDLSIGSVDFAGLPDDADVGAFTRRIDELCAEAGARVGVGRYDEARRMYAGELFRSAGAGSSAGAGAGAEAEWRTVHIGLDLFVPAGTAVRAPLDGTVHSFADNAAPGDYGPTIVLRHRPADGVELFTLYGHLSRDSLDGLTEGAAVRTGEPIARIGDASVNGGWPPHLHFQLMTDMLDERGDFPGVAPASQRAAWLSLCPDPNLILGIPEAAFPPPPRDAARILDARRDHLGGSLSVAYRKPLHIVRSSGRFLFDIDGRRYLDAVNNVPHVGHGHPRVVRAGQRQMAVLNTNTRYLHESVVRYAERLCALLPEPLEVCLFVCSGSEANELALRLARAHAGGRGAMDCIVIDGAYHGNTSALVDLSPYKFDGPGGAGAPDHVHKVAMPDPYRGPFGADDPDAGARYADDVARAVSEIRAGSRGVAAFFAEPMLGCGGQIVLPPGYLRRAFEHVRAAGGVCVADEVQVGFGRPGTHFWAFETQDVVPDVVTLGKPIGNGHPLGAVVTTRAIAESFDNGMEYFNTFGGNPVSCAIGMAVLDVIEDEGLQDNARCVGDRLLTELRALAGRHRLIGDVRGKGLFVGVELVVDRETRDPAPEHAAYVIERMKERGVLLSTDGPLRNVLKIKPPLVFTADDADRLCATLDEVLGDTCLQR